MSPIQPKIFRLTSHQSRVTRFKTVKYDKVYIYIESYEFLYWSLRFWCTYIPPLIRRSIMIMSFDTTHISGLELLTIWPNTRLFCLFLTIIQPQVARHEITSHANRWLKHIIWTKIMYKYVCAYTYVQISINVYVPRLRGWAMVC